MDHQKGNLKRDVSLGNETNDIRVDYELLYGGFRQWSEHGRQRSGC